MLRSLFLTYTGLSKQTNKQITQTWGSSPKKQKDSWPCLWRYWIWLWCQPNTWITHTSSPLTSINVWMFSKETVWETWLETADMGRAWHASVMSEEERIRENDILQVKFYEGRYAQTGLRLDWCSKTALANLIIWKSHLRELKKKMLGS